MYNYVYKVLSPFPCSFSLPLLPSLPPFPPSLSLSPSLPRSLSLSLSLSTSGPPDIVIAPSNTDVLLGNTVLLTCVVAFLNTPPELSWHRNDTGELYNTSDISIYTSTIEEGGVMFLRSILELCGVELSDEGLYFCQAAFDMNPDRTSRAYFYVDVFEGMTYSLTCCPTIKYTYVNLRKAHTTLTWFKTRKLCCLSDIVL